MHRALRIICALVTGSSLGVVGYSLRAHPGTATPSAHPAAVLYAWRPGQMTAPLSGTVDVDFDLTARVDVPAGAQAHRRAEGDPRDLDRPRPA